MTASAARRWIAVALLAALAALLQWYGLVGALRYDRVALANGEVWRVLTGHLVHLGWMHLALNVAGLALVCALVGPRLTLAGWTLAFLLSALAVSGGLWLCLPGLNGYVGLSGVLHGLLVAGAAISLRDGRERGFGLALLGAVAAKLAWEQFVGPTPGTAALAGGPVVVDAHLFGAAGGLLCAGIVWPWRTLAPRTTQPA